MDSVLNAMYVYSLSVHLVDSIVENGENMSDFTHFDKNGNAIMVDVSHKD